MSDGPGDVEARLGRFRPRQPSAGLRRRIAAGLAGPAGGTGSARQTAGRRRSGWMVWLGIGAAATAALWICGWFVRLPTEPGSEPAPATRPGPPADATMAVPVRLWSDTVVIGTRDEGVGRTDAGGPVRRYRCQLVDYVRWQDDRAAAAFQSLSPREEMVYVRLPVQ